MRGDQTIYQLLEKLNIDFEYHEHEAIPTIELALIHKKDIEATHCKNVFMRNHKGKKHYYVVIEQSKKVNIRQLELLLKQGKLSFASDHRLEKYLSVKPGAVSPLGLVHDKEKNSKVFIDQALEKADKLSFHPNVSDASLVIKTEDLIKYLNHLNIQFEFINLKEI